MRKIFLLSVILFSFYFLNAQSSRGLIDNQANRNTQFSPVNKTTDVVIDNITVYPNPVADMLKVSFKSSRNSKAAISLFNNIGKQVFSQESDVDQGNNLFVIDIRNKAIEPGIYFVQCLVEDEIFTRKLIVK